MSRATDLHDALVIGGGPTGATAALALRREGLSALVVDRAVFPRFHIGESFLPRNMRVIRELGLEERLAALPQVAKYGAEFGLGDGSEITSIVFDQGLAPGEVGAFNIERAPFDATLLGAAREAGAEVVEGAAVRAVLRLADGEVAVALEDGRTLRGRWLIDASGQGTVVGRHLGIRRVLPRLKKVAFFGHFSGVWRSPGIAGGFISIVMCDEGWFWLIPLDERRTSIGLVLDADAARATGVPPNQMLAWAIRRTPLLAERTAGAVFPAANHVAADFSYRCEPYAGPGYFLAGDAATFVDPIFSTGVCLGMVSAVEAARGLAALLRGTARPEAVRRRYVEFVRGSSEPLFRMVHRYYDPAFRDLFLDARGPLAVHRAIISVLAGHVFPRPIAAVRWRLRLLDLNVALHRRLAITRRRRGFSLLAASPSS
ncbi:MAG TPA: NAD(P)/FAD-dependent oxidoreductase [Thermoanaerobaculia bacterium]|nr:NAD(P)/FAD-dependent oxidoreductase [Thermoanaerobaculia bacterium]